MQKSEFLSVFEDARDTRDYARVVVEKIKSHGLPIIVFGASRKAEIVTRELKRFNVEVLGYAVDEEFYKPNQTYLGRPVFNFDVISREPGKYVFVLGMAGGKIDNIQRIDDFFKDKKIISYRILGLDSVFGYDYICENQNKFFETYSMLSDDLSRQTMMAYLKTNITDNPADISDFVQSDEYFNEITRPVVCGGGICRLRSI